MLALYRKYRPKKLADILGQETIVEVLSNAAKSDKLAHAYLFFGPRGSGKTTMARLIAKIANCQKRQEDKKFKELGEPCNQCLKCQEIDEGRALDVIEIDAASNRGIDEIRNLKEGIRISPTSSNYKVYIIDECHQLTKDAFNALLKTLEEPPAHAIFILATTDIQKVPETIVSRTQHYEFHKIALPVIVQRLAKVVKKEGITADKDALQLLALFADGGLRDAESMLGQVLSGRSTLSAGDVRLALGAPPEEAVLSFIRALLEKDAASAARVANEAVDQGIDPQFYLKMILRNVRYLLLARLDARGAAQFTSDMTDAEQQFVKEHGAKASVPQLEHMMKSLIDAYWMSYRTVFPQLPPELAVVDILRDSFGEEKKEEVKEV